MLIVCSNCTTAYEIDAAALGAGRSVRCARCRTSWFAEAQPLAEAVAQPFPQDSGFEPVAGQADGRDADPPGPAEESEADSGNPADLQLSEPAVAAMAEDAPPLAPAAEEVVVIHADETEPVKFETKAARRARVAREKSAIRAQWRPSLPAVILALAALSAGLIGWRTEVVRLAPQTATFYAAIGLPVNLRGLVFDDVKIAKETHEGVPVLVVQGNIANVANRTVDVPRLRFALRSPAGVEAYTWTALPSRPALAAKEVMPFRSQLASPPAEMHDVMVRFFSRRDFDTAH